MVRRDEGEYSARERLTNWFSAQASHHSRKVNRAKTTLVASSTRYSKSPTDENAAERNTARIKFLSQKQKLASVVQSAKDLHEGLGRMVRLPLAIQD